MSQSNIYHTRLSPESCCERVIVCGDPARAQSIAARLDNSEKIAENREYHSYVGQYESQDILVISHGVGSAGATICFRELMDLGAKRIVRIGTAGALRDDIAIGDLVIATGAVREDGASLAMIPAGYPAVANLDLTQSITGTLLETPARVHRGIVLTSDLFYPEILPTNLELYSQAGVSAVDMECATLLTLASLKGVAATAVFGIDGNPLKWDDGEYDPGSSSIKAALEHATQASLKALCATS